MAERKEKDMFSVVDFCIAPMFELKEHEGVCEIRTLRQGRFEESSVAVIKMDQIVHLVETLRNAIPDPAKAALCEDLYEMIELTRCMWFNAGYRDGMADLMTAMSFNEAKFTHAEYALRRDKRKNR